jgi:hypothetical protein
VVCSDGCFHFLVSLLVVTLGDLVQGQVTKVQCSRFTLRSTSSSMLGVEVAAVADLCLMRSA